MSMNFSDAIEVIVDCGLLLEELGHGPHRQKIEDAIEAIELEHDPKWRCPSDEIATDQDGLHYVLVENTRGEDSVILGYKDGDRWFCGEGDEEFSSFNSLDYIVKGYQPIRRPKVRYDKTLTPKARESHAFLDKAELNLEYAKETLCIDEWSQEQIDAFQSELQGIVNGLGRDASEQGKLVGYLAKVAFHEICKREDCWPSEA